ncbi:MAG: hypothetical protein AB7Q81_06100 [Gammaproteobacteria bacterium]
MRALLALTLLLLTLDGHAGTPLLTAEQARAFARARVADARDLLLGPGTVQLPAVDTRDCAALYTRRLALFDAALDRAPMFWDEPRHVAAVVIGTIWTPAFYYLPYRAVAASTAARGRHEDQDELAALRRAAAEARCFER